MSDADIREEAAIPRVLSIEADLPLMVSPTRTTTRARASSIPPTPSMAHMDAHAVRFLVPLQQQQASLTPATAVFCGVTWWILNI